jgi:hypothetical protein
MILHHEAITHVPWWWLMTSSPVMPCSVIIQAIWCGIHDKTDDVIAHAAIYQWSFKLFMLQSISGLPTRHNVPVLNYYVAMVSSKEIVFCWICSRGEVVKLSMEIPWHSKTLKCACSCEKWRQRFYGASKYFFIQRFVSEDQTVKQIFLWK